MKKSTKAQISQSWPLRASNGYKLQKKDQMKYYMGAKLLEVGVNPKRCEYRWTVSRDQENQEETWTYSAYWGDSKAKLLGISLEEMEEQERRESGIMGFFRKLFVF